MGQAIINITASGPAPVYSYNNFDLTPIDYTFGPNEAKTFEFTGFMNTGNQEITINITGQDVPVGIALGNPAYLQKNGTGQHQSVTLSPNDTAKLATTLINNLGVDETLTNVPATMDYEVVDGNGNPV